MITISARGRPEEVIAAQSANSAMVGVSIGSMGLDLTAFEGTPVEEGMNIVIGGELIWVSGAAGELSKSS